MLRKNDVQDQGSGCECSKRPRRESDPLGFLRYVSPRQKKMHELNVWCVVWRSGRKKSCCFVSNVKVSCNNSKRGHSQSARDKFYSVRQWGYLGHARGVSYSVLQSARDASRGALRFRVTQFGQCKAELLRDRSQFLRDFVDVVSVIRLNEKAGFRRCPEL